MHSVLLLAKRSRSNLRSLAHKQACRLVPLDYLLAMNFILLFGASVTAWCHARRSRTRATAEQSALARYQASL